MVRDIELGRFGNITPIGSSARGFTGTFDGDGNTISNPRITATNGGVWGLFGVIGSGGQVYNVELSQPQVTINGDATVNAGSLVGINRGIVRDCIVRGGSVTNNRNNHRGEQSAGVGGLIGLNDGGATVERSHIAETISVGTGNYTSYGGLVGINHGAVVESSAKVSIDGAADRYANFGLVIDAGGLIGHNTGTVDKSYAIGDVKGYEGANVGGLVGMNARLSGGTAARITHSYSAGTVTIAGNEAAGGGLVGRMTGGSIADSYTLSVIKLPIRIEEEGPINADIVYYNDRDEAMVIYHMHVGGLVGRFDGLKIADGIVPALPVAGLITNSYYIKQAVTRPIDVVDVSNDFYYTPANYESNYSTSQARRGTPYERAFVDAFREFVYQAGADEADHSLVTASTVKKHLTLTDHTDWLLNTAGTAREVCVMLLGQVCDRNRSSCDYGPYRDWDSSLWRWDRDGSVRFPALLGADGTLLPGQRALNTMSDEARAKDCS